MDLKLKTLVNHPLTFAIGVGLANGLLAKARGKKIDLKTLVTLGSIIGLGEAALVMYEPPEERGEIMSKMSLMAIGLYSCGGLYLGLLPFLSLEPHGALPQVPILAKANAGQQPAAVGGFAYRRRG